MPEPQRRPLVAANWKMNKTRAEAAAFAEAFARGATGLDCVDVVLCPPATALAELTGRLEGSAVEVAAQNMHEAESGAFTGELSAGMLNEVGAWGAILGHSERRQLFGETDEALAAKVPAALAAGLVPILCVGETEAERDAEATNEVLSRQLRADLDEVAGADLASVVVAYEPIWAIGTGRNATPQQAQEAIAHIRGELARLDAEAAARIRILYGGSMKPGNAAEIMREPDVDGGLVGGASLDPADFLEICRAAQQAAGSR
jgi:triosephosphate isomerase (TIM)